jgi:hypothetical protein
MCCPSNYNQVTARSNFTFKRPFSTAQLSLFKPSSEDDEYSTPERSKPPLSTELLSPARTSSEDDEYPTSGLEEQTRISENNAMKARLLNAGTGSKVREGLELCNHNYALYQNPESNNMSPSEIESTRRR